MRDFSPARPGLTMRPSDLTPIHDYPRFRPELAPAPFLPMSRADMNALGWDSCDIVLVTGDAYIDHPSFGMALIGRLLEAQGFRVGILAQPDYTSAEAFRTLGRPNLFFGVTAGNMDSMINRYTAERKPRSDDAYTPGGQSGARPDRATVIYSQRCREAFPGSQVMAGGIEASLRRIAQYDYWSETVRQSALVYTKADLLLFGNAERALIEIAHRAGRGERLRDMRDIRGTAFIVPSGWRPEADWHELDSTELDLPRHQMLTEAVWWTVPPALVARLGWPDLRVGAAAHAMEHTAIGLLPAFAPCDRWDIGGLSTALHPDTGAATIFVHDGMAGGAGFAARGFEVAEAWLGATLGRLASCDCDAGCPACIVSPKCGNANQVLNKADAAELLSLLLF